jgi:GNAT superfamily N-acetyltransferase
MTAVRSARPSDLHDLVRLCAEHAHYERAEHDGWGLAERLEPALFGPEPRLLAWVVEAEGRIRGYASATVDFSTWNGRSYLHLDCLYLEECLRGRGLARRLMDAVFNAAREAGIREVQWQTPDWNDSAIRFYEGRGARGLAKVRFSAPA